MLNNTAKQMAKIISLRAISWLQNFGGLNRGMLRDRTAH
jgi:hypothetical protein